MFEDFGKTALRPRGSLADPKPSALLAARSIRGAFDLSGKLIPETVRHSGARMNVRDDVPQVVDGSEIVRTVDSGVVWGGAIVNHYGHFLTESVARLWSLLPGSPSEGYPVVLTTPRHSQFASEWIEAFGLQVVDLPLEGFVHFEKAFIPEPAWRLNGWITPEMRDIHAHARQGLAVPSYPANDLLWFSRAGLDHGRAPYDERLFEWIMRRYLTSIRPEALTIAQQVGMVESSRAVSGVIGSAFHTLLMSHKVPECLYLCPGRFQSAHMAQNEVLGAKASFAYVIAVGDGKTCRRAKAPGGRRILIPEALRALHQTILPSLLDDEEIQIYAYPESFVLKSLNQPGPDSITSAIVRVLIDPFSIAARMKLGACFETEGLSLQAAEQFAFVAELSEEHLAAALSAARLFSEQSELEKAVQMATRALAIDPTSARAKRYLDSSQAALSDVRRSHAG